MSVFDGRQTAVRRTKFTDIIFFRVFPYVRYASAPSAVHFLRMPVRKLYGLQIEGTRHGRMETPVRYFQNLGKNVATILKISRPSSVGHSKTKIAMVLIACFQFEIV